MKSVLITRPEPGASDFAEMIRSKGLNPVMFPIIKYEDVPAQYNDIDKYSAFVFTSAQALRVFAKNSGVRDKKIFTVGDKTAEVAKNAMFTDICSADGDVEDLVKLIEKQEVKGVILHLCSADTPKKTWERRVIYKSIFSHKNVSSVVDLIKSNKIGVVTLLSAKTAMSFLLFIKDNDLELDLSNIEAVCISQNVKNVAGDVTWKNLLVSSRPTALSMLDLLIP